MRQAADWLNSSLSRVRLRTERSTRRQEAAGPERRPFAHVRTSLQS